MKKGIKGIIVGFVVLIIGTFFSLRKFARPKRST